MRILTLLTFSAALACANFACSDDDSGKPGTTTSGTTTGTTSGTTTGTTTGTTSGTTSGNGSLTIAGITSTALVQCQNDAQNLVIDATGANANTCNITLGSQPTATSTYTIINAGQNGSAGAEEAIILCRNNNGLNPYYSTSGTLQVTVTGTSKQISFNNILMRSLDDSTITVISSASLTCP